MRIWQLDGTATANLVGHTGLIAALPISPDGQMIATSGGDRAIRLWDWRRDNLHVLLGHQGPVNSVTLSPKTDLIASGGSDGTIRLWQQSGAS